MKSPAEIHEFFVWRVAEAYLHYLISIHRRPVYRHECGDIEVDRHFLVGLLDGYLQQRHSLSWCGTFCRRLLLPLYELPDKRVIFIGGRAPVLNRRGIKYMNALVGMYGDMLVDFDLRDASGMLRLPSDEEFSAVFA